MRAWRGGSLSRQGDATWRIGRASVRERRCSAHLARWIGMPVFCHVGTQCAEGRARRQPRGRARERARARPVCFDRGMDR
ncbi:hypothetical protein NL676_011666 [Syzygium grande]|nr:hypothetical protein NL676_011666 [Syzygium grande]